MSAELEVKTRKKRKTVKHLPKTKHLISVRYRYSHYTNLETPLVGRFRDLYPKYKDRFQFWCADVPPEAGVNEAGFRYYTGYQLGPHHLAKYGNHKAWLDPTVKVNGKSVILVFNAE